jgi:putative redox protein
MESVVRWAGGLRFDGRFSTGHSIVLDGSSDHGGGNEGPRPVEMLLMGLAGCTGMDVIAILQKKRQSVSAFRILVSGERREEHPRVFKNIHVVYEVTGKGIDIEGVRQAVHLSEEKYCSVSAMLRKAVDVTTEVRVLEEKL